MGPGDGPCPLPATVPPWWEKTGWSLLCLHGVGLGDLSCHPWGGGGGERNIEKGWRNAPGCASRQVGGKTSAGARLPLPKGKSRGGGRHPPSSLQCPHHMSPRWGKKASASGPALSPCLHSVLSWFPEERRLPPVCHAAITLCSPALTLLLGDLCVGGHQCPPSSACREESCGPRLLTPLLAWVRTCHMASEEETRITNGWTHGPADTGGATSHHHIPDQGSPEGAWSMVCALRAVPRLLP